MTIKDCPLGGMLATLYSHRVRKSSGRDVPAVRCLLNSIRGTYYRHSISHIRMCVLRVLIKGTSVNCSVTTGHYSLVCFGIVTTTYRVLMIYIERFSHETAVYRIANPSFRVRNMQSGPTDTVVTSAATQSQVSPRPQRSTPPDTTVSKLISKRSLR